MSLSAWMLGLLPLLVGGQTQPAPTRGWMDAYRQALHLELVTGDLPAAIDAYKQVAASGAPKTYTQQALYRWALALRQLGRDEEASRLLERLTEQLVEGSPLAPYVARQLSALKSNDGNRLAYWKSELKGSASTQDLARLREAAEYLSSSDDVEATQTIRTVYEELHGFDAGRSLLLKSLGDCEWPDAVPLLRSALNDSSPQVVSAAEEALGMMGDAASIERLLARLSAKDVEVRRSAIIALHALGAAQAVDALRELAQSDVESEIRKQAATALRFIGTAAGLDALASMPAEAGETADSTDGGCMFSEWYRRAVSAGCTPVQACAPRQRAADERPRIGVVVSAMTHHAPDCDRWMSPYTRQIRKAWTLQRAGFEVVLLAEPEAMGDADALALASMLRPAAQLHPLGSWPPCDAIVVDTLLNMPASIVQTLAGWCEAGGQLIVCGATGGGFCGDGVTWRRLIGVRRLHSHGFSAETARLMLKDTPLEAGPLLPARGSDWAAPRRGTLFLHTPLAGTVVAEHDAPSAWAIKLNRYGLGRVLCLNWDVGMSTRGTNDEDELLCRYIDMLLGDERDLATAPTASAPQERHTHALWRLMQRVRWGQWSQAKSMLTAETLRSLDEAERAEAVMQLANVYLMENNFRAGRTACEALLTGDPARAALLDCVDRLVQMPRRVQISLQIGNEFPWWLDVPGWQRLVLPDGNNGDAVASIPLWLAGPSDLRNRVRVRIAVPAGSRGRLRLCARHAERAGSEQDTQVDEQEAEHVRVEDIDFGSEETHDGWYEFRLGLKQWDAFAGIELVHNQP